MIMTVFSVCYGMEKEPGLFDRLFGSKKVVKTEVKSKVDDTGKVVYECNICFNSFEKLLKTACKHEMCAACLGSCATSNNRCPWCNQDVVEASNSQYLEGRVKFLNEDCNKLRKANCDQSKTINEQNIKINMLNDKVKKFDCVASQLQQRDNELTICLKDKNKISQELLLKNDTLNNLISENRKIAMVISAEICLRCLIPLVLSKQSSLIATIATNTLVGIGAGAAQVLIVNDHDMNLLYSRENRSQSFLSQFFLMGRIGRIGLWTAFFNSMLEMPWKQRLITSVVAGAGLEAIDILLMQKTKDRRSESTPCNLVGLAGVGLGLGINTLSNYLKLTGAIKDN